MISVVIPYYKNLSTIERCLLSVKNQTEEPQEIIVVNDCSPDWSEVLEILKNFNGVKIISHQTNKNGSAARNTGIKEAKGEFIALLDADDEWYPNHLKDSLIYFNSLSNINAIVYCKNLIKTGRYKDLILPFQGITKDEKIGDYLFINDGFISTPSMFGSSKVFKQNLFDETLIRHQDYQFLIDLESKDGFVTFSSHLGVIVHWENNDIKKKGGTWDYSLKWIVKNKKKFTNKAYRFFILRNIVFVLFQDGERLLGIKIFLKHCIGFYSIKFSYKIISMFLFGRIVGTKI